MLPYATWYYTKYFPSRAMLAEKLLKKYNDTERVAKTLEAMDDIIVERENIESRVHSMISQGKTKNIIRQKLRQKKFDPNMLEHALAQEQEILENPETYRHQIEQALRKGVQKGASKKGLQYELSMKYPEAKTLIHELLETYDDVTILGEEIPDLLRKYTPEKIISKLSQKGFRMNDISAVLRRQ